MKLRFQQSDAVDEEVREQRGRSLRLWPLLIVLFGVVACARILVEWLFGAHLTLHNATSKFGWPVVPVVVVAAGDYFLTPIYSEFRLRSKEIDSKLEKLIAQNIRLSGQVDILRQELRSRVSQ